MKESCIKDFLGVRGYHSVLKAPGLLLGAQGERSL